METRIRDMREDRDLKQVEVCEAVNLSQRTYSYYETGGRMVPPEVLCALADFYDVSVDYLLRRTNIPETADKILKKMNRKTGDNA